MYVATVRILESLKAILAISVLGGIDLSIIVSANIVTHCIVGLKTLVILSELVHKIFASLIAYFLLMKNHSSATA